MLTPLSGYSGSADIADMRARLAEVNSWLSSREVYDALRTPVGRYIPELRIHDSPSPQRMAEHERAVALVVQARAERDDIKTAIAFAKRQQRCEPDSPQPYKSTLTDWVANGGKDKTKRAQRIRAEQHRESVKAAFKSGVEVRSDVLADYGYLTQTPEEVST